MNIIDLKVLIIDDDPMHAKILEQKLLKLHVLNITKVDSYKKAKEILDEHHFDILFLDFYLDEGNTCLDLSKQLLNLKGTSVIYISAFYDETIFDQIPKYRNVAFLSKTSSVFEIKKELTMLLVAQESSDTSLTNNDSIFVKKRNKIVRVTIADIMYIEVDGKYLNVKCQEDVHIIRMTLKEIQSRLPDNFLKIHQSIVVNMEFVSSINVEQSIIHVDNNELPISRAHKKQIFAHRYFK